MGCSERRSPTLDAPRLRRSEPSRDGGLELGRQVSPMTITAKGDFANTSFSTDFGAANATDLHCCRSHLAVFLQKSYCCS